MLIWNLFHTLSLYANRWGGPRYRTTELSKFVFKHFYEHQIMRLIYNKKINANLASEAFLSANHTPYYMNSIESKGIKNIYIIEDELGYKAHFAEGTKILIHDPLNLGYLKYEDIKNIKSGNERIINFELVETLKNDKLHHHRKNIENFYKIKCSSEKNVQETLCDSITSMILSRSIGHNVVEKIDKFEKNNIQQIYFITITNVEKAIVTPNANINDYEIKFMPFSYVLMKDRSLSNKSNNRYHKTISEGRSKKYLEKLRSRVFAMKKDKIDFSMELTHEEDNNNEKNSN